MLSKVLYVDDENPNLFLFKMTFINVLEVITASSADEGMKKMAENPDIDMVISDMRMPKTNGLEFITEARSKYQKPKYCLLTGFDITDEIERALESKLLDKYFRKPFNKEEILQAVLT